MSEWWCDFFDCTVAGLILNELRDNEIEFLMTHLRLGPGSTVFDQCCGWGRVAGPLAERGVKVWGVDASPELIVEARKRWPNLKVCCDDAAGYDQSPKCDAGMNLYSSFGYSREDAYNQEVLNRLVASVRSQAMIVIDTINPDRVYGNFQPEMTRQTACGSTIRRLSELQSEGRLLSQTWEFRTSAGQRFTRWGVTRLYSPEELGKMLRCAGCSPLRVFGDFQSGSYNDQSERLIWLAQK